MDFDFLGLTFGTDCISTSRNRYVPLLNVCSLFRACYRSVMIETMYSLNGINALYGREVSCSKISASRQKTYRAEYSLKDKGYAELAESMISCSNPDQENDGNVVDDGSEYYCIECVVNPCEDLVIERSIQITFVMSNDYLKNNDVMVIVDDVNPFLSAVKGNPAYQTHDILKTFHTVRKNGSSSNNALLCFPWLQSSKQRYHIAVWFYTARNTLKVPSLSKFDTPLIISQNLPKCFNSRRSSFRSTTVSLLCGAGRTRGRRSYMEDVDFFFPNMKATEKLGGRFSVFGVLDGHGGQDCARYCSEEIPTKIAALLRSGKCPAEALFQSFLVTDKEFISSRNDASGSTCSIALWDHISSFYIANTGDTRAVLCRSGRAIDLTVDRKASDPDEIARVCEAGGYVANGRVMGSLAVSRALGDVNLKTRSPRPLIVDPDITTYTPSNHQGEEGSGSSAMDEFILVATDGLWDVMSSAEAVTLVRELMGKSKILPRCDSAGSVAATAPFKSDEAIASELSKIADYVVNRASKTLGSQDNVTLMIIRIDGLLASFEDSFDNIDDFEDAEVNAYSSTSSRQIADFPSVFQDGLRESRKTVEKKKDEDDLMSFLLDDGNF